MELNDESLVESVGEIALPPYIHEPLSDPERYQTVYARVQGSVAAPTAGLHFTQHLLQRLVAMGIETAFVTLHVGLDTFRPVEAADPRKHQLHTEYFDLSEETAEAVSRARVEGRRIIAVGTADAMVTNFHLPRSTLLTLVAAFAGRERVLAAYREAMEEHYRFYSFGDGMVIL